MRNVFNGPIHHLIANLLSADLQREQPALYDSLTKILNHEEQQIIQGVIHEADVKALASGTVDVVPAQANGGA